MQLRWDDPVTCFTVIRKGSPQRRRGMPTLSTAMRNAHRYGAERGEPLFVRQSMLMRLTAAGGYC